MGCDYRFSGMLTTRHLSRVRLAHAIVSGRCDV
jgi:hypothetical protein